MRSRRRGLAQFFGSDKIKPGRNVDAENLCLTPSAAQGLTDRTTWPFPAIWRVNLYRAGWKSKFAPLRTPLFFDTILACHPIRIACRYGSDCVSASLPEFFFWQSLTQDLLISAIDRFFAYLREKTMHRPPFS